MDGSDAYNQDLLNRRVEALKGRLKNRGINVVDIEVGGTLFRPRLLINYLRTDDTLPSEKGQGVVLEVWEHVCREIF